MQINNNTGSPSQNWKEDNKIHPQPTRTKESKNISSFPVSNSKQNSIFFMLLPTPTKRNPEHEMDQPRFEIQQLNQETLFLFNKESDKERRKNLILKPP